MQCDCCPAGIWGTISQRVARLREEAGMLKLFTDHVKGEEMYGLRLHAVLRITESVSYWPQPHQVANANLSSQLLHTI